MPTSPAKPLPASRFVAVALLAAALVGGCATRDRPPALDAAETLPRYGDATRQTIWDRATPAQRLELPAQSRQASERGWSLSYQGRLDEAMARFNRAWLLDPDNPRALWGMGIVQFERARASSATKKGATPATLALIDGSASLMDDALAAGATPPGAELVTDAAFVRATRGGLRRNLDVGGWEADFDAAGSLLQRAEAMRRTPQVLETWAVLEEYRGYPRRAAEYRAQARQLRRDGEVTSTRPTR